MTVPKTMALQTRCESGMCISTPTTEQDPCMYVGQQSVPSTELQRAYQDTYRKSSFDSPITRQPKNVKSGKVLPPCQHDKTSADDNNRVFDTGERIHHCYEDLLHHQDIERWPDIDLSKKYKISALFHSLEGTEECKKTDVDKESSTTTEQIGNNIRPGSQETVPEETIDFVTEEEKLLIKLLDRDKRHLSNLPDKYLDNFTVKKGRELFKEILASCADENAAELRRATFGDIMEMNKGLYSHFALYLGLGLVIHYSGDGTILHYLRDPFNKASVKIDVFSSVVKGYNAKINNDKDAKYRPFSAEEILRRAFGALGRRGYNVTWNNCEHFVSDIRNGRKVSYQVDALKACCYGFLLMVLYYWHILYLVKM